MVIDVTGMFGKAIGGMGYHGNAFGLKFSPLIIAVLGAFWIWMLIDALKKNFKGNDKLVWVIVLLFSHIIGAVIYFFLVKSKKWLKFFIYTFYNW